MKIRNLVSGDIDTAVPPVTPEPLKKTDCIGVIAPGGPIGTNKFLLNQKKLEKYFKVTVSPCVFKREGYLAGTDSHRTNAAGKMFRDKNIKAIMAARGGYGTGRIIDRLNLKSDSISSKWLIGSSDITILLLHLFFEFRLISIHGPMVCSLNDIDSKDFDSLLSILRGEPWTAPSGLFPVIKGQAEGPMIGGNLTVITTLCGIISPHHFDDTIVFLEDTNEAPYKLDRCLNQLVKCSMFDKVKGFILGNFSNCESTKYDVTAMQAILKNLEPLNVPVIAGYPAAHVGRNYPFLHGLNISMESGNDTAIIDPAGY